MFLSKINFDRLENMTSPSRWGINSPRDRSLFKDSKYWYKVWGSEYVEKCVFSMGDRFIKFEPRWGALHGFEVGLYTEDNASALEDFIFDFSGRLRGYICRVGQPQRSPVSEFSREFFDRCKSVGWLYTDFCFNNVVEIDGAISLIDFDTHLCAYDQIDIEFERKSGALRPHVFKDYSSLIYADLGI